jgi:hypothetical protein
MRGTSAQDPSTRIEEPVVVGGGTVVEVVGAGIVVEIVDVDPGAVAVVLNVEELVAEEPLGLHAATTATRVIAKTHFTRR